MVTSIRKVGGAIDTWVKCIEGAGTGREVAARVGARHGHLHTQGQWSRYVG